MTAEERILEDADRYGFSVPYDGTSEFYDRSAVKAYIAGARSEFKKKIAYKEAVKNKVTMYYQNDNFDYRTVINIIDNVFNEYL